MKDLKYLLALIVFVVIAHSARKKIHEKTEAKFLPDIQDVKEQRLEDSGRVQVYNRIINRLPSGYNHS